MIHLPPSMFLGLGAAASTVAGAAVLGSLFGAAGAGVAGYKMNKRVGDVEEFTFVPLAPGEGSRLHVMIAVPGWLPPPEDDEDEEDDECGICFSIYSTLNLFRQEFSFCWFNSAEALKERLMGPLDCLAHAHEQYGLQYETKYLAELGQAMKKVVNLAVSVAATKILKMTVLHSK